MRQLRLIVTSAILGLVTVTGAAGAGFSAFGVWFTQEHDGAFELYPCRDGQLCGRLVWMADDGGAPGDKAPVNREPPQDTNNPDLALRTRLLCGLEIVYGFRRNDDGLWSGGFIYNPDDGHEYHAQIDVRGPDILGLRGYILMTLLGQTQIWSRVPPAFTDRCQPLPKRS